MNLFIKLNSNTICKILRSVFVALFSLSAMVSHAQLKFTTIASSNEVGKNDYIQVQFVISNAKQIDQFTPPNFPDFQVVEGPSQSTGMSNINGNIAQYQSISYVLQPTKTGKFTIPGASATVDGKSMRSNSITINVNATSTGAARNNVQPFFHPIWPDEPEEETREYVLKPGENISDVIKKNLFVKVQVSKNKCYVGEPIVATYKLYSSLRSESRVTKLPSMNGFSVYDMMDPNKSVPSYETVNGKKFTVHVIRKAQLIPLESGSITLDPVQVDNDVYFLKGGTRPRHHSLLDDFFDNFSDQDPANVIEQHVTLNSPSVEVNVSPLPEKNKPEDFSGAVGNFLVSATIDNEKIAARDEGTVKVTVKGTGNLPMVNAPTVSWPATVDGYDAAAKENIDKTVVPMNGSKTFEYPFSPKTAGDYTIPGIVFSFFDPASNSYKTQKTGPISFHATQAAPKNNPVSSQALQYRPADDAHPLGDLIEDHLEWIFAVIILTSLAVYFWRQNVKLKKMEAKNTLALQTAQLATPVLTPEQADPLLRARRFLDYTDYKGFYQELSRATWNALCDKLQIRSSELNKHNVIRALQSRGWGETDIIHLEDILHRCEMNLYTPDYSEVNSQQLLQETEGLLSKL